MSTTGLTVVSNGETGIKPTEDRPAVIITAGFFFARRINATQPTGHWFRKLTLEVMCLALAEMDLAPPDEQSRFSGLTPGPG
jgi:hypothetical protein